MTLRIGILNKHSHSKPRLPSRATQGRLVDPVEYLAQNGRAELVLVEVEDVQSGDLRGADVLFASRPLLDSELEALTTARSLGVPVAIDLADNITINPIWTKLRVEGTLLRRMMSACDVVTVTNPVLADVYRGNGKPVMVLRTGFDLAKYAENPVSPSPGGRFLFTMCNADHIKSDDFGPAFASVVRSFVDRHDDAVFHFFADEPFAAQHPRIINLLGNSFLSHKRALAANGYHLAIMMMGNIDNHDDAYILGKSPVKYWEHGAFGIPGAFSDNPVYRRVVRDGTTGFLVRNDQASWNTILERAYENRSQLAAVGKAAKADIATNCGIAAAADDLLRIANATVGRQGGRADDAMLAAAKEDASRAADAA